MNILVINGSPHKDNSVTLQYVLYLEKKCPEFAFSFVHTSLFVNKHIEELTQNFLKADILLWAFPVYYFSVPASLKFCIEFISASGLTKFLSGKYASGITTSVKLFDYSAHKYIQQISEKWGMLYIDGYSAEKNDFLLSKERERLLQFAKFLIASVAQAPSSDTIARSEDLTKDNQQNNSEMLSDKSPSNAHKYSVLYTADYFQTDADMVLNTMRELKPNTTFINLSEKDFAFCTGCMYCGYDNKCIKNDGFDLFFDTHIKHADPIIYIIETLDLHITSRWKSLIDRSFFNGHVPVFRNKRVGVILIGNSDDTAAARGFVELWLKTNGATLCGVLDKGTKSVFAENDVLGLLASMEKYLAANYSKPEDGRLITLKTILTPYVTSELKPIFYADKVFYRKAFSFKKVIIWLRNIVLLSLLKIPAFRRIFYKKVNQFRAHKFKTILKRDFS